jgi:predicted esterase
VRHAVIVGWIVVVLAARAAAEEKAPELTGTWWGTFGELALTSKGDAVTGTYGAGGRFTLEGTRAGRTVKVALSEGGPVKGEATFEANAAGTVLRGTYAWPNGNRGTWNLVRQDPKAEAGAVASFAGTWVTERGPFVITQTGAKVEGRYPFRGPVDVTGEVKGRRLTLRWKGPTFAGGGWLELAADKKSFAGVTTTDGQAGAWAIFGTPLAGHPRKAKPKAGAIVSGLTSASLAYHLRWPVSPPAGKGVPCLLLLHGSNMTSKAYVNTVAGAWPDLARRFVLLGIDGETCVDGSPPDAPQCNYTYTDFVGRSTFRGFPGTDRQSPALVAEAMDELGKELGLGKVLVGGHSQGAFLTYSLVMNFPEKFAGAFPVSGGLIFQAEPTAYADAAVRAAQRKVPWAIVHGRNDGIVDFSSASYAHAAFLDGGFPALRLFDHPTAAHLFAMLPVRDAVRWLDALTSDDVEALVAFGEERAAEGGWRDAIAAARRARTLPAGKASARLAALEARVDATAKRDAATIAAAIAKDADGAWVDGFLAFRAQFEFAPAASPAMDAYAALRARHQPEADARRQAGRTAMQAGDEAAGWAAYQEIVDRFYASSWYPVVKGWIAARDATK